MTARIHLLDFLRGSAVLGMLVVNMPWHAGDSMARVYDPDVASVAAWLSQYLIFDQRFMPIFAMLFGSGLLLMHRPEKPLGPFAPYYLKRMAILLAIGICHAYLLWPGDILITYAVCGPFLLLALHLSPARLIVIGIALKMLNMAFNQWPELYELTVEAMLFTWWVDYGDAPSTINQAYAGGYGDLFRYNVWRNQFIQWTALPYFRVWNALGFMLIGMGLFKLGIIQGLRSPAFYRSLAVWALVAGIPLVLYGIVARIGVNETVGPYLGFTSELPLSGITFLTGCAITSLAMLSGLNILHPMLPIWWRTSIERVGRMALTNYLMQSVLILLLFHGLKLLPFDALDPDALFGLTVAVWLIQIGFSRLWLSHHDQGPVEALWRRLCGPNPSSAGAKLSAA
ncbi:MAG: DUF418 domain-containing protein [Pseudomonadota bacterium]